MFVKNISYIIKKNSKKLMKLFVLGKKTNELGSIKTPKVDFEFSAAYRVFKHAL